ncbi:MFS transporter [Micromonospora fluostatini]|uniref:MFS transporter n=1 Tax=Micromonospora fluostatini TaxID=1629071 RepID=A0ABY2DK93_9ACTN|nr:MFS transporter [Micromonospora fluostatini]
MTRHADAPPDLTTRSLLRNGPFVRLTLSLFLLRLGTGMTTVGLPLLVLDRYGLGLDVGLALGIRFLPNIFLGAAVGHITDRYDPRRVAVYSALASAAVVALFPFTTAMWQIQVLAFLVGLSFMFGVPTRMALRPAVMPSGSELRGNSLLVTSERLTSFLGPATAGPIVAFAGIGWLFGVEAVTAVLAAVLLLGLPPVPRPDAAAGSPPAGPGDAPAPTGGRRSVGRVAWDLVRRVLITSPRELAGLVRRDRLMLALTVTAFTYVAAVSLGRVFLTAFETERWPDSGAFAYALAAMGVGGVLGGLLGGRLGRLPAGWLYLLANVVEGLCWLVMPLAGSVVVLIGLTFVAGVLESVATVVFFAEVQRRLPASHMGRYYAGLVPLTDLFVAIGFIGGAPAVGLLGLGWSAVLITLLMAVPVLAFTRSFVRVSPAGGPP